ncbi:hypothetical protein NPX79_03495 [Spiroplasma endosymbiont of Anurida maritima]|uniref:hypothetical protein n=1 Tax=Spiroplasma endosymbiont of Anurida maritima TaxID=2967972 RepID=UPI0036D4250E
MSKDRKTIENLFAILKDNKDKISNENLSLEESIELYKTSLEIINDIEKDIKNKEKLIENIYDFNNEEITK